MTNAKSRSQARPDQSTLRQSFTTIVENQRGRYLVLFIALCSLGLLYPILGEGMLGLVVWNVAFWIVFLGGLRALVTRSRYRRLVAILAGLAFIAGVAALFCYQSGDEGHGWINTMMSLLNLMAIAVTTGLLLLDVMKGGEITLDRIIGAGCVYVLLGLLFSFAFMTLHSVSDQPVIQWTQSADKEQLPILAECLYFSFVTLTTLGIGDLVPTTMSARLLVGTEAIVGQLYLTILVARLVGLHIVQASRGLPPEQSPICFGNEDTEENEHGPT